MAGCKDMTLMEMAVGSMLCVFMQHQNENGKLCSDAFKEILAEQMPSFNEACAENKDEIFKKIDVNKDGTLDFPEFCSLVCSFACANHAILEEVMKCAKEKHGKP
ncbi:protein S100-A11-like [Kryptolebias marmoratus]|uniref:protein S100-A11-like n=1 Tax=Kryptolebias marmoratus TaxID=37003 RepID=UPI0007F8E158|nr:protein S100-A11-like [Kryptolebias marmoratus]